MIYGENNWKKCDEKLCDAYRHSSNYSGKAMYEIIAYLKTSRLIVFPSG